MLKTIFGKTLFEKRWVILAWTLAIFITNLALIQIFPPVRDAFSSMLANIPESMQGLVGNNTDSLQSLTGYVSAEIFGQMALVIVVFSLIFSSSVFASEEKSGLLLTQLARPISRWSFFAQKYLAFTFATVIVLAGFFLGTIVGILILGESLPFLEIMRACLGVLMLGLGVGSLTFALGAMTGSSGFAGAVVGSYMVLGYLIVSLMGLTDVLNVVAHFASFYYYNNPNLMYSSLDIKNVLILLAIIVVPLGVALPIFTKRDLRTR